MSGEFQGPSEEEMINMQNEAEATNEMVDKGLLTPEEASKFDINSEIKISEALLSKAPELTEKLQEYVVSKFPPENFLPDNIAGTVIHGTSIRAIRPIWLGEGQTKTYQGASMKEKKELTCKGRFYITGDFTRLDRSGFNHISKEYGQDMRLPGSFSIGSVPVFLIVGRSSITTNRSDEIMGREITRLKDNDAEVTSIKAVILTKPDDLLVDPQDKDNIDATNTVSNDTKFLVGGKENKLRLTIKQETNYIAHCMVEGVDKSKIVPIYDWDGNLLWPKAEKEQLTEQS